MSFVVALRHDLTERARTYALAESLPHCLGYRESPIVCFALDEHNARHGNFLPGSYKAIRANPAWRRRSGKVHAQAGRALPRSERGRWMELDSGYVDMGTVSFFAITQYKSTASLNCLFSMYSPSVWAT